MTFGALPFLIAAAAGLIPVLLHLFSRNRAKELPFSTLRFLRVSAEKTRRRKRLHDLLLMLVRIAALVLVALGLAKPTLTHLGTLWGGEAASAVAIVLDNSASMGVVDHGRPRLQTGLQAAEQILDELNKGDQVTLWLTCGPPFPEQGKVDRTHEKVRQVLALCGAPSGRADRGATLRGMSYERADMATLVERARMALVETEAASKYLYVITDLQRSGWEPSERNIDVEPDASDTPDTAERDAVPIVVVDCHREPEPNVAVTAVRLDAALMVAGRTVKVRVELLGDSAVAQQRHVELYIDGVKVAGSRAIEIPAGGKATFSDDDFAFSVDSPGLHRGEVRLVGPDGSSLDDRRFFTVETDPGVPVAIVGRQRHEIPYLDDTFYLQQALAPGRSDPWAIRPTMLTTDELRGATLSRYKVVFCVNLPVPDAALGERLRAYVAGGGNLVWFCGDRVDPDAYNRMNRQAGDTLLPARLLDVRDARVEAEDASWNVAYFDAEHPALRHLVEPPTLYQSVLVYKHVRIDEDSMPDAHVMARLDDGEPLLVERKVEKGQVVLAGISAHIDWSNLPLRPVFLPLLARLTLELSGTDTHRLDTPAGGPLLLPLGEDRPTGIEVFTPDRETIREQVDAAGNGDALTFRYDDTHEIGIYEMRPLGVEGGRATGFAVNVAPGEADPSQIGTEELQEHFGDSPLVMVDDPDDLSSTFVWLREGKSLWELFLAGVLVALVFETFLANTDRSEPARRRDSV
ncbi:MAG: BatA domain-containing protein [Thermoguttaceae bacterium]